MPFLAHCSTQWHTFVCCPVLSFVRNWGTRLADTHLIPRLCVNIVPTEIPSSSTSSLIVKCQFLLTNSLMWSAILLVWAVDGQPVCGSLLMAVWPFLKLEYHSDGLDWLSVGLLNVDYSILHVLVAAYQVCSRTWERHSCTLGHLTQDWIKFPPTCLLCIVNIFYQISYMIVTSIPVVVSL